MRVNDLERTVKFYQDALGLTVSRRNTSPRGAKLAFLKTPNSDEEIELCQLPNSPSVEVQPDLMHLAFAVDDVAAATAELARKGYQLSGESDHDLERGDDRIPGRPGRLRGGADPGRPRLTPALR